MSSTNEVRSTYYDNIPFPFTLFPFLYPIVWPEPPKHSHLRIRDSVDFVKIASFFVPLLIIAYYGAWNNQAACLYVVMHGTYGFWWVVKSNLFPDRRWEANTPTWHFFVVQAVFGAYFAIPWYICAYNVVLPAWRLAFTVMTWACGLLLIFVSDMQKTMALELAPGKLITDKMFTYVRNPNYLGELLNYLSFVSLAGHWLPFVYHFIIWALVILPGVVMKEKSLKRYPEFREWQKRSWSYVPFLW